MGKDAENLADIDQTRNASLASSVLAARSVPAELDEAAHATLAELVRDHPLGYTPILEWRGYRVAAGMAYCREGRIGLSSRVLKTPAAVRDTLVHEYAHLLAWVRHGRKSLGHGPLWQKAMRDLGAEPVVRHQYEVERNGRRQRVVYRCAKCGFEFAKPRRFPRSRRYAHVNCGGLFELARIERVTTPDPAP
jgi:SprT protein